MSQKKKTSSLTIQKNKDNNIVLKHGIIKDHVTQSKTKSKRNQTKPNPFVK